MSNGLEAPTPTSAQIFDAIVDLERRCVENAAGLPKEREKPEVWVGVLFMIGNVSLLTPLSEITEVLNLPPDITRVPSTRLWVRGVANNRGTLLPIFDLQAYLYGSLLTRTPKNRVLVVREGEFAFGLLVADVIGIRHFAAAARRANLPKVRPSLNPYLNGSFTIDNGLYPVFSLGRLGQDAKFSLVAA